MLCSNSTKSKENMRKTCFSKLGTCQNHCNTHASLLFLLSFYWISLMFKRETLTGLCLPICYFPASYRQLLLRSAPRRQTKTKRNQTQLLPPYDLHGFISGVLNRFINGLTNMFVINGFRSWRLSLARKCRVRPLMFPQTHKHLSREASLAEMKTAVSKNA